MCRMLFQSIAIVIGTLSLAFGIWQYRRTRVPRLRLTCAIGVFRASFETGGHLEQPIIEVKALNVGHVPVTLDRLSARSNGRDVIVRLWDATDRPYETELDLADHNIPPLAHYPSVAAAREVFAAFRRHQEERRTAPLMRFVPDGAPSGGPKRKKRKRK